jgi:PPM family protein phosphatase
MVKVRGFAQYSQNGNRPIQEDLVQCDPERGIFILADGFGGGTSGMEAAQKVCESIRKFLFKEGQDEDATLPFILRQYFSLVGNVLFNSVLYANQVLFQMNQGKNVHEKGGASVIAAYLDDDLLAIANVGTCLAWMVRGGQAAPLVMPRTYGQLLQPHGEGKNFREEDLQIPLMAYGMYQDLEPEILEYQLRPGDWVIFSSDGFLGQIDSGEVLGEMLRIKQAGLTPEESLKKFSSFVKTLKTEDNASISLLIF